MVALRIYGRDIRAYGLLGYGFGIWTFVGNHPAPLGKYLLFLVCRKNPGES